MNSTTGLTSSTSPDGRSSYIGTLRTQVPTSLLFLTVSYIHFSKFGRNLEISLSETGPDAQLQSTEFGAKEIGELANAE